MFPRRRGRLAGGLPKVSFSVPRQVAVSAPFPPHQIKRNSFMPWVGSGPIPSHQQNCFITVML